MRLGAMNNPMLDVVSEIEAFAALGFDFLDLALEPPQAYAGTLDIELVRKALDRHGMGVIGHTAWYMPIASVFPDIRETALREMETSIRAFRELGVEKVSAHPHTNVPLVGDDYIRDQNIAAFSRLVEFTERLGMKLMLENPPRHYSRVAELKPTLDAVPGLGFHLDIGHANLRTPYNRAEELVASFSDRLEHVHVSDNKGGDDDLHLPLGVGNINWHWAVAVLKNAGYDGTVTVEVFSEDDQYLMMSKRIFEKLWQEVQAGERVLVPAESRHASGESKAPGEAREPTA